MVVTSIREFNQVFREKLSAVSLTIISAFAGISAASNKIPDELAAFFVVTLVMSIAYLAHLLTLRKHGVVYYLGIAVSAPVSWYALGQLTGLPLTSASLLLIWIALNYGLQLGAEYLDDELDSLRGSLASSQGKLQFLETIEPLALKLDRLHSDIRWMKAEIMRIGAAEGERRND